MRLLSKSFPLLSSAFLEESQLELRISEALAITFASLAKWSERAFESKTDDGRGDKLVAKIEAEADEIVRVAKRYNASKLGKARTARSFIKRQRRAFKSARRRFEVAIAEGDEFAACAAARNMLKSIELLAAIHPSLMVTEREMAEPLLSSGHRALVRSKISMNTALTACSKNCLDNIASRVVLLRAIESAVADYNFDSGFQLEGFYEALLEDVVRQLGSEKKRDYDLSEELTVLNREIRKGENAKKVLATNSLS